MNSSMGLELAKPEKDGDLLLCTSTYRSFHDEGKLVMPAPFTVLRELKHPGPLGGNQIMKIMACAFPPNDDSSLLTLTTFAGVPLRSFRAGFVQCWDLRDGEETHDDSLFTYSPRPACCFSPNGKIVSFILNTGNGHVILVERTEDYTLEPYKIDCDIGACGDRTLLSRALCCVFSPDGSKAVTVSNVTLEVHRGRETNEICMWKVMSKARLKSFWRISCEVVFPKFYGHLVSCVFSPDSSLLAFSTSAGQLFILSSKNLELWVTIASDIVADNACSCAFDPCFPRQQLAVCYLDGTFQIWILENNKANCVMETQVVLGTTRITAFSYSPDGSLLAFGTSDGKVLIFHSDPFQYLYELNSTQTVTQERVTHETSLAAVCSVAFSNSCQELAVGQSDSLVRIWQLPVKFELQHMCRLVINQLVPPNHLYRLPIPRNLKSYLQYSYLSTFENERSLDRS